MPPTKTADAPGTEVKMRGRDQAAGEGLRGRDRGSGRPPLASTDEQAYRFVRQ